MSTHTPGPWQFSHKTKKTKNFGVYASTGHLLATLDVHQLAPHEVLMRRRADARLMAAAPDLLVALAAILPFIPSSSTADGGAAKYSAAVIAADMVRAAIAKATGATA